MNGIFGAGPADQDYEAELESGSKSWEPTFSEQSIARQWDLPAPSYQQPPVVVAPPPVMAPLPVQASISAGAVRRSPAPPQKIPGTITIPSWLPWALAVAGLAAVVYVVSKKPEPKPETV